MAIISAMTVMVHYIRGFLHQVQAICIDSETR